MKIAGIVSEFNPFHKGHRYICEEVRSQTGADAVVALMSGNFVQRGEPAIFDMGIRAEAALNNGCDIVFELPPDIAVSSAEGFARGAIDIFNSLGIDILSFGSECGDIHILNTIAGLLAIESPEYKKALNTGLKRGLNFPAAREEALLSTIKTADIENANVLRDVLNDPNNILGIEYLKALISSDSKITPFTIKRTVTGYHTDGSENNGTSEIQGYSAEELRHHIFLNRSLSDPILKYIDDAVVKYGTVDKDRLSMLLCNELNSPFLIDDLKVIKIPEDLSKRIIKNRNFVGSFSDFCALIKSKNITYTAVSRYLLRLTLNIGSYNGNPPRYVRLLGFRKKSEKALTAISERSKIHILTNSSDIRDYLKSNPSDEGLNTHLRVDRTYELLRDDKKRKEHPLPPEISRKLIII